MAWPPVLVWFRRDLRLADNPALSAACASGAPVLAVYILDTESPGRWTEGGASRWWLNRSLEKLGKALAERRIPLLLRRGRAATEIPMLAAEVGAQAAHWNRLYEPHAVKRDVAIKQALTAAGVTARSHNAALLLEPWEIKTAQGGPFQVFTPFWRAALAHPGLHRPPLEAPARETMHAMADVPNGERLEDWGLHPSNPDWSGGLARSWTPGEAGAQARLSRFLDTGIGCYRTARDRPGESGTSRLSPHLHFGEIGPRQVLHAVLSRVPEDGGAQSFLRELGWREFCRHLLYHHPHLPERPLREAFDAFPWSPDARLLAAWQKGRTGYPIVDAGMRELWSSGWMHNRVRMITASFLVKDLLQPWQAGQDWFWDTLVDADLANNAASWQWVAGCGADAAPFFRIFNPVLQSERFDPEGAYLRRWLPELADLPAPHIHRPWQAPPAVLDKAGVRLGKTWPQPLVDHAKARERALAAWRTIKG